MMHRRPFFLMAASIFLLSAFCLMPPVFSQSATATLSGTVEDERGAVIPGAAITVLNPSTALQRETATNDNGSFTVTLLQPGTYAVTVRRGGFAPIEVKNVVLNVGDQKALKIQLKAGDVNATVQVSGEASLINESPAVATTIDRRFVGNLPLNGRTFQSLILLTPGVVSTPADETRPGQFSVNGQRSNTNYFTVDGVSANIGVINTNIFGAFSQQGAGTVPGLSALGTTTNLVALDALEEFKIQTSTYSAEFGRQPGGQVQLVTRSGGNEFHGTAFEYIRNEVFDAANWFTNAANLKKPPLRQNDFGGTFSGPVYLPKFGEGGSRWYSGKNRTFFFFSYEGQRLRLPVTTVATVPSLRVRQIAAASFSPLLNAYPLPTGPETLSDGAPSGHAAFTAAYSNPSNLDSTSIRLDHTLSEKLAVFGRYNHSPSNQLIRQQSMLLGTQAITDTLTLGATMILSSRLSGGLRFNWSKATDDSTRALDSFSGATPISLSQLTSGYAGRSVISGTFDYALPGGSTPSLSLGSLGKSYQRQVNIVGDMSVIRGNHRFKVGADYRREAPIYGFREYLQTVAVLSEADLVSGIASFLGIQASARVRPIFDNWSAYAQDTWRISPRLTIDYGIRWELNPAPHEASGLKPPLVIGVDNLPTATLAPAGSPFYKTFYTNFAPRVGIAYQLGRGAARETVLRGGFGVYHDLNSGLGAGAFTRAPFTSSIFRTLVPFPIPTALAAPAPFGTVTLPTSEGLQALDPNLKLPFAFQWNATVEQSLGKQQVVSVSYVGSKSRRLLMAQQLNTAQFLIDGPRPNGNLGEIVYTTNGGGSDYNSLQVQYQRRFSGGMQGIVNYTWSHAIDDVSNMTDTGTQNRGNADFDVPHNFSAAISYDLPKAHVNRMANVILGGWSLDATVYARSGQPLDIRIGQALGPNGSFIFARPDAVSGVPFWISDSSQPGGRRVNLLAFRDTPFADDPFCNCILRVRQGTLARNVVRGPSLYQVNLDLRRKFKLTERWSLQLKGEVFNVFNHPMFGGYDTNFDPTSTTFGVATTTLNSSLGGLSPLYQLGGPRSVQFAIRLAF
jgi:hypothetical protein